MGETTALRPPEERTYSFDPACYTLAEHFLGSTAPVETKRDLAQDIQNVVESFMLVREPE